MGTLDAGSIKRLFQLAKLFGKSRAIQVAQSMLVPHVINVFGEHEPDEVKRMVATNYPLAKRETPEKVKRALDNLGSSEENRKFLGPVVQQTVTPDKVLQRLKHPEEWLPEDAPEDRARKMQECAGIIENHPKGRAWLNQQVYDLYSIANLAPGTAQGSTSKNDE